MMTYQMAMFPDAVPDVTPDTSELLTKEEEYAQYIRSLQWKQMRARALQRANGKCERCGASKWSRLEVHHLTYARFKREALGDLVVLCSACHKHADKERPLEEWVYRNAKIENWAKWKFGNNWANTMDWSDVVKEYLAWRAYGESL